MRFQFCSAALLATFLAGCAAPAPQPGPGRNFVLFYTEDSAYLGDDAKAVVQQAADALRAQPGARAHVRGFAAPDTGSPAFNRSLAQTRALAVVDQLALDGVPRSNVLLETRGPVPFALMPTESRRVEIVVGP